jgi:F0F1-type ATP synthase delta subunit
VELLSAGRRDDAYVSRLERQIHKMLEQLTKVRYRADPESVAGATVRIGDAVIDGRVAGQLQSLQEHYSAGLSKRDREGRGLRILDR